MACTVMETRILNKQNRRSRLIDPPVLLFTSRTQEESYVKMKVNSVNCSFKIV